MSKPSASKPPASQPPSRAAKSDAPPAVRVTAAACVRCGQPVQARFRPFCSQRCADIDLGQWLSGRYRVPTDETPTEDGES